MSAILQVVDGDGEFNTPGVADFVHASGVEGAGVDYTVVAIMGPQSSGKSTLLNHLFGTRFEEMDALSGRHQTTKGVWLARSPKVAAPPTLVMDLEGSDGRERGEDDTSFERQSALFALATADVLLVNMWAKDVGREAGSGKPLLKTIFQVNLKLFQPAPGARRTVLLFVFRDRTRTPLDKLRETWEADLQRMWDGIAKPPAYEASAISDFFELRYAALSNYEDRGDEFLAESTLLRRRFTHDADEDEGLLRASASKLPGQALALSMGKVWEVVHDNRDLNLPAHRVMVANIRCAELADEAAAAFEGGAQWVDLAAAAQEDLMPGFGAQTGALLDAALAAYDAEARYFDPGVSAARGATLAAQLQAAARPAFDAQLALACGLALESFKLGMAAAPAAAAPAGPGADEDASFVQRAARATAAALVEFDAAAGDVLVPGVDWTAAASRESLQRQLAAHAAALREAHVVAALGEAAAAAEAGVSAGAMPLLEAPPADLWPRLAAVVDREAKAAAAGLAAALRGYGVEAAEEGELWGRVRAAARGRLLANAREAANTALPRLKERFGEVFQKDELGMPRTWSPSVDVPGVAAEARRAAARLLAQLAVVRLAPAAAKAPAASTAPGKPDAVETAILRLAEAPGGGGATAAAAAASSGAAPGDFDLLSASAWPGVAAEDVLLPPAAARTVWRQFSSDVALAVQQAAATQEANRLAQNRLPPFWAIVAMAVLGFNEAVAVLRNPLLLAALVLAFLFAKTVYAELDVEGELARGLLPGAMALSAKFVPTVKAVAVRTFESARAMLAEGPTGEGAGGTPPARGGAARVRFDGAEGLRNRRREVEMAGQGGGVVGGDLVGDSRKDD